MLQKNKETKRKQPFTDVPPRYILWGSIGVVVLALLFLVLFPMLKAAKRVLPQERSSSEPQSEKTNRHPLTGVWLSEPVELPRVFGVMIDDQVDAWPQSGIDQAFLVIEAPVEASIPRMIAFFDQSQAVEKIGPVRSARPYFIDWNNEFDALYAHVGGSNEALDKIENGGTFDLNEYSHSTTFWRATTRMAPHNAYTSTERLNEYLQKRIEADLVPELLYESWQFKDPEDTSKSEINSKMIVDYWAPTYTAQWNFDAQTNQYVRFQGGKQSLTLDGNPIKTDNVGVVVTDVSVLDAVGRRKIRTTGEGKAWVLQDGTVIEAVWKKPSISQRLRFYVQDQELKMNPGKTWIQIVPSEFDVTFLQE